MGSVERRKMVGGRAPRVRRAMLGKVEYLLRYQDLLGELHSGHQYSLRYVPSRTLVLGSGCWRRDEMESAVIPSFLPRQIDHDVVGDWRLGQCHFFFKPSNIFKRSI